MRMLAAQRLSWRMLLGRGRSGSREGNLLELRRDPDRGARPEGNRVMDLKFRIKMTCKKHPQYDPRKTGEAGIKGGCMECTRMLSISKIAAEMVRTATSLDKEKSLAAAAG
jgi:hypothetical protein